MALQTPEQIAAQYYKLKSENVGASNRTVREQTRSSLGDPSVDSNINFRNTQNTFRGAGWKDKLENLPSLDSDTQQTMAPFLGNYIEGGKQQQGYYGKLDPYESSNAGTILGNVGYKPTEGMMDAELESVFGKVPKAFSKYYIPSTLDDITTQAGRDSIFNKSGYSNVTPQFDNNMSWLPGYTDNTFGLKGSIYKQGGLPNYLFGDNNYTRKMQDNGYMYDLMDAAGVDMGDGYYNVDESLANVLKLTSAKMPRQDYVQNSIQQYVNPTWGSEGAMDKEGYWESVANPDLAGFQADPSGATQLWTTGYGPNNGYFNSQQEASDAWLTKQQELISKADTPTEKLELLSQALSNGGLSNVHSGNSSTIPLMNQLAADFAKVGQESGGDFMKFLGSTIPGGGLINRAHEISKTMDYNHDLYDQVVKPQITTIGDNKDYTFSGNQANIGSTPVWKDGKIVGYKNTLDYKPGSFEATASESYKSGSGIDKSTNSFNYQGQGANYITQNDPNWWAQNVTGTGNNSYFIAADKVANNPGYTSKDIYQAGINDYEKKAGLVSQLGKAATGMVLGGAFGAGGAALGGSFGGAAGASAGQALGGALPGALQGAASGQDWQKILANAGISAAGGYLGSTYGGDLGGALGVSDKLGSALIKGGVGGLGSLANGGGLRGAVGSALGSLAGYGVGAGLESMFDGDLGKFAGQVGSGVAKTAVKDFIKNGTLNNDNIKLGAVNGAITGLGNLYAPSTLSPEEKKKFQENNRFTTNTLSNIYKPKQSDRRA